MSNTQYVFINKSNIPTREQLQRAIDKCGYDLILDPELSLEKDEGFSPCVLNNTPDVGFELLCEPTSDTIRDDPDLAEIIGDKDTCILLSWGGSMEDCLCAVIVSYVLVKDFGAITSYEGEEIDTLESLLESISELLSEIDSS